MSDNRDYQNLVKKFTDGLNNFLHPTTQINYSDILKKFAAHHPLFDPDDFKKIFEKLTNHIIQNPEVLRKPTESYSKQLETLWQNSLKEFSDLSHEMYVIKPDRSDRRFKDSDWHQNHYYNNMMQNYLLWVKWIKEVIQEIPDLDVNTSQKIQFYIRQFTDLMAPTNFFWLNPETLRETISTQGQNLIHGMTNFLKDFDYSTGKLDISMVDKEAFKIGENIAITPGQVIFKSELFELIHYSPSTPKVYDIPLLIVPPCINKFYVFDLRPEKSFVKWCCDQGLSVYIISWVNPGLKLSYKTYEDYILQGLHIAVQEVLKDANVPNLNSLGFCIGGNFLSSLNAYLNQIDDKKNPIRSTTYLATLFDFEKAGDIRIFLNKDQLELLEKQSQIDGYISGRMLAHNFNLMRANDLIWSFMINNYYLGKTPEAIDFLFWNSDSTTLPSVMYIEYLKNFFLSNCIVNSNILKIKGIKIDFKKLMTPSYVLNTKEDHIAPWKSGYAATQIFNNDCEFVLGGSGHIAGIFNAPDSKKYNFWHSGNKDNTADHWLETAEEDQGSWWQHWLKWIKPFSGKLVDVNQLDLEKEYHLGLAPGTYVKETVKV